MNFLPSPFPPQASSWGDDMRREVSTYDRQAGNPGSTAAADRQAAVADPGRSWSSCRARTGPLRADLLLLGSIPEVVQQLAGRYAQAASEPEDRCQPRLPRTALHAPDGRRVDVRSVSEGILREALPVAQLAQPLAERGARPFGVLVYTGLRHPCSVTLSRVSV
jgi:hypothetical protein